MSYFIYFTPAEDSSLLSSTVFKLNSLHQTSDYLGLNVRVEPHTVCCEKQREAAEPAATRHGNSSFKQKHSSVLE